MQRIASSSKRRVPRRSGRRSFLKLLPRAAALVVDSSSGMFLDPVLCSDKFQQSHVFTVSLFDMWSMSLLCGSCSFQVLFFGFYACPVEKASRSKMNVPLLICGGDEALEMKFLAAKDPGGGSYPAYLRGNSWDEASGRRVQGRSSISLSFRERISRLNSSTWRSSFQSSIILWADWNVVNYAVLGPDSQAIRGLYAVVPGQGY